ncbi:MAG: protein TolQ [Pseudomonadota bacterium]|nr:protein TolQ [Pseudomonadota bacterium]
MEQDIAAQVVGLGGASDFTLWSLFMRADFVVKFVIILLIASSIFSWALIFDKFKLFKNINKSTEDFEKKFWKAKSAENFNSNLPVNSKDPATLIFKAAMAELLKTKRQSAAIQSARVERILEIATDNELKKVEKNFTYLATIGSTAPFIGLFGTVWGIMNSFQSIAISRNTSLAIVAPGIAEALFATALGLLAAIPAVVAYNKFNSDSRRYFSRIDNFSKRFLSII